MTDTLVAKLLDGEPVESLTEATREMMKPIHAQPWEKLRICKANTGDKTKRTWFDCVAVIDPVAYLKHKHGDVPSEMQLADFVRPAISSSAATAWAARIPECEQIAYGRYLVADTDISVVTLCSVWPKGSFIFDSEETQMRFYYLYLRFQAQLEASKIRAEFKINGHIPDAPPGFIDHPKHPLSPYQFVAAATCLGQEAFCLFLDRGLGKTAIAINRIQNEARLIQEDETRRKTGRPLLVLVVAPKNVRHNWKSEIERFATLPGQVTILAGGQLDRIKQLIEAVNVLDKTVTWSVVIASYDSIPRSWDAIKMLPWPLRGLHPDSGSEFINRAGIAWCKHRRIELTRSRPSKKNDNCYVEQRNLVVVRKYVGYERYDCVDAVIAMNELYETLLLYLNFFQPTFKLQGKAKRVDCDNKQYTKPYRRVYDKPKTPNRRVLVKT
jgi:hypothetical protein